MAVSQSFRSWWSSEEEEALLLLINNAILEFRRRGELGIVCFPSVRRRGRRRPRQGKGARSLENPFGIALPPFASCLLLDVFHAAITRQKVDGARERERGEGGTTRKRRRRRRDDNV